MKDILFHKQVEFLTNFIFQLLKVSQSDTILKY
jgi:hypothetical protein